MYVCWRKLDLGELAINNQSGRSEVPRTHNGVLVNALVCLLVCFTAFGASVSSASAETRSLKLYYIHTKERAEIVFKRNGKYDKAGLNKINRFLRDWRRNEPTRMDPQLLDLVWEAYRASGAHDYIHVVSAYRSPATNEMLRKTRGGQATKSQHMLGKALDFYIPGVPVKKLREIGFKLQGGGVGYYPRSGVPFVHLDTGNVRAWPRMSRSELARLFPKGGTLHLPPDGKPLPGYEQALAAYKSRQAKGLASTASTSSSSSNARGGGNLLAALFGGGRDEEEDEAEATVAARPSVSVASAPVASAPVASAPAASQPAQTPGTQVAALARNKLPIPLGAPRAADRGVPVAITPPAPIAVAAAPAPAPQAPVETQVAALAPEVSYQPPVPGSRPAVLVARAPAPAERRTAREIEQALAANDVPIPPAEDAAQRDDAAAILAALAQSEPRTAQPTQELAYAIPVPSSAPRDQIEAVTPAPVIAQERVDVASLNSDSRGGRLIVPGARPQAPAAAPAETQTAALPADQLTTAKTARATVEMASLEPPAPRSKMVAINPDRFGSWATTPASLTTQASANKRPDFIKNAQREAPEVVYTAGFSAAPPPDSSSFSGNAVTFLAVAKFSGGNGAGGNGQPLELQIPATN